MAASVLILKMAAICAVLVILLSSAGQPAMAYVGGPSCPSTATPCLTKCAPLCHEGAQVMCKNLCSLTPSGLNAVDQACVNHFVSSCMVACKNMCEHTPVQTP